jgi:hypothetical protein
MTIAVGILCHNGVVLGADREIGIDDTAKTYERKAYLFKRDEVAVGIVAAGTGELGAMAAAEVDRRLVARMTCEDIRVIASAVSAEIFEKYIVHSPFDRGLKLLVGAGFGRARTGDLQPGFPNDSEKCGAPGRTRARSRRAEGERRRA